MHSTPEPTDRLDGERRKDGAHALLSARRELYVLRGRRALLATLLDRGTATADDVRSEIKLPEGIGAKLFGAVPGVLARAGIIEQDAYARTARPAAHARPLTVWKLKDRAAAVAWMSDHPDRPAAGTQLPLFDSVAGDPAGQTGGARGTDP